METNEEFLKRELPKWSNRALQAIAQGGFNSTIAVYWPEDSQIAREQDSPHFCLSFQDPRNSDQAQALALDLSLRLQHNNADAYVYMAVVTIQDNGTEENPLPEPIRKTALMTVGVSGDTKIALFTYLLPSTEEGKTLRVEGTVQIDASLAGIWANLLDLEMGSVDPQGTKLAEIYNKLVEYGYGFEQMRDSKVREVAGRTQKISKYYSLVGEKYLLQGMSDLDAYEFSRTFLGARNLLPESEMPKE